MADQDASDTDHAAPTPALAGLAVRVQEVPTVRGLPPVHLWNPPDCGDIGLQIAADGAWWHEGTRFTRPALAKLFSTLLRAEEDGSVWVVTPHEKVRVEVADLPFLAVRLDVQNAGGPQQRLVFTTNQGDVTVAGPGVPLIVDTDAATGSPRPRVRVRGRLDARLTRPVFMELAELVVPAPSAEGSEMGVWSDGVFFSLGYAA